MYHRFSPVGQNHPRRLPIAEFDWQMKYLARHHPCWLPDEQLDKGQTATSAPVVITVDDGYADFASLAAPVLQQYGLTAAVFLTTGFVSGQTWFWWDRLTWLLENCPPGRQRFRTDDQQFDGNTNDSDGLWILWHTIADHLSTIDDARKEASLVSLAKQTHLEIPASAPPEYAALSWKQIRKLAEQGIVFGAHTVDHPVLSRVDTLRADHEIRESGQQIAAETGRTPRWFCYPQGGPNDFLPETAEQVRRAGYHGCYVAFPNPQHDGDPMTLPRYSAPSNPLDFQWLMCGAEYLFTRRQPHTTGRKGPT